VSELDVVLAQVFGMPSLVYGRDGEGAACTGRRFFKYQRDVLAGEQIAPDTCALFIFQIR